MSTSTSGSGGVKNLLAVFENKRSEQSTSPPNRGRSPNGSVSSVQSRPLSKVRASFVAVERPGEIGQAPQWGLRKASDLESMDDSKEELLVNGTNGNVRQGTTFSDGHGLGMILKGSPFEDLNSTRSVKPTDVSKTTHSDSLLKQNGGSKPGGKPEGVASIVHKLQIGEKSDISKRNELSAASDSKAAKPQSKITTKQQSPTATKSSPKIPVKTPTTPTMSNGNGPAFKPKGGVSKIKGVMESAERAKQVREEAASGDSKSSIVASKPTTGSKERTNGSAKNESSRDPETTRSAATTRATKLPSAATQTTTAAAAKREHGPTPEPSKPKSNERRTTVPQAAKASTASTRSSLAKKSSRPSLAPANEKPKPRLSTASPANEDSFLSRMTRPTASTAQKAHEKVQVPPSGQSKRTSLGGRELPKKSTRKVSNVHGSAMEETEN